MPGVVGTSRPRTRSIRYVTIVIGADGVQPGLVRYPGGALPDALVDWRPGVPMPVPAGSILFYLDPPAEAPRGFRAKAARYGWPADAGLVLSTASASAPRPSQTPRTSPLRA